MSLMRALRHSFPVRPLTPPEVRARSRRKVRHRGYLCAHHLGEGCLPNIKSARKWTRASAKRRQRNLNVKTELKTIFKKATSEGAVAETVREAASAFDKAAVRGIIHKNKANRKKSRLAKRAKAG